MTHLFPARRPIGLVCGVALALGLTAGASAHDVLLLSGHSTTYDNALVAKLQAAGHTVTVGPLYYQFDGSQSLAGYEAVILVENAGWGAQMPASGQTALLTFVNAGGGLITAEWTIWSQGTGNRYSTLEPCFPVTYAGVFNGTPSTVFTQVTSDVVLNGGLLASFTVPLSNNGGTESNLSAKPGANTYYDSSNLGVGLVGWNYGSGKVLSFSPILGDTSLNDSNFGRLAQNAVQWVATCNGGTGNFVAACEARSLQLPGASGDGVAIDLFNGVGGGGSPTPEFLAGRTPSGTTLSPRVDFPNPGSVISVGQSFNTFFANTCTPPAQVTGLSAANFILRINFLLRITSDLDRTPGGAIDVQLGVGSDDGFHLTVGNTFLGQTGDRGFSYSWFDVPFEAPGLYPVTLLFSANAVGASGLELSWNVAGAGTQIIPQSAMYLEESQCTQQVRFDELTVNSPVADQYRPQGVIFTTLSGNPAVTNAFPTDFIPLSAPYVFGSPTGAASDVELRFVVPGSNVEAATDYFSCFVIDGETGAGRITAYAPDGSQIFTDTYNAGAGTQERVEIAGPLARVVIDMGDAADVIALDNLCFNLPYSIASADLRVTDIAAPPGSYEPGESMNVSWTVRNDGSLAATGSWTDRVFLSGDNAVGGDIFLGDFTHAGLDAGASYTNTQSFVVPGGVAPGTYYLVVATDAGNDVAETARETNNSLVDNTTVPVLAINSRVLFVNINGSYNPDGVNFYNTVVTAGATATYVNLSANGQVAALLAANLYEQIWVYDLSTAGDNYPADYDAIAAWYAARPTSTIICDGRIISSYWNGRYTTEGLRLSKNYFENIRTRGTGLVLTTDHNAFHNQGINQINSRLGLNPFVGNFNLSFIPVDVGSPLMTTPNNMGAQLFDDSSPGQTPYGLQPNGRILYTVAWHSNNRDTPGISATIQGAIGYAVHITQPANGSNFSRGSQVTFSAAGESGDPPYTFSWSSSRDGSLGTGASITVSNLSVGTHTITVLSTDSVSRADDDQITVVINPIADLRVTSASAPSSAAFGDPISVTYNVANDGDSTINGSWTDRIYLSQDTAIDGGDTLLWSAGINGPLGPAGTYQRTANVTLPINTSASGQYHLLISADDSNGVPEFTQANNVWDRPITLSPTVAPDLVVQNLAAPASARFADQVTVSFDIRNSGNAAATNSWTDAVYLSVDQTVDGSDARLASRASSSPLAVNGTYTRSIQVVLPANYIDSGAYYVLVRADDIAGVVESSESNNTAASPIQLQPTLGADLTVESVVAPSETPDGVPASVTWTVRNIGGTGASSPWYDRVYLSLDTVQDNGDLLVGQFNRPQSLAGNGTYSRTESVPVAAGLHGPYYFIVRTDAGGTQAEPVAGGENNNVLAASATNIVQANLPDFVATELSVSEARYSGQAVTLSWRVRNVGIGTANGSWIDRVRLSEDDYFDPLGDFVVGQQPASTVLPPGGEVLRSITFNLPVTPGLYRYFVSADDGGAVNESDDTNNVGMLLIDVKAPDYVASVEANLETAVAGTPVTFFGTASRPLTGEPVPDVDVDIFLSLRGTERVFRVHTNENGDYGYIFFPIPGEAGRYSLGARHPAAQGGAPQDQFTIYGMGVSQSGLSTSGRVGQTIAGQLQLVNQGDTPLTGITFSLTGVPSNLNVSIQAPSTLGPQSSGAISYSIVATNETILSSQPQVRFTSTEGATAAVRFFNTVVPLTAELVAEPTSLSAAMVRGQRSYVQFTLRNTGGIATQELEVFTPGVPWMRLTSPAAIPPIAPGGEAQVVLELNPAADLPLGPYGGAINVGGVGAGVSVPFSFLCMSLARGSLEVHTTDEFTYFADGAPPLTDAEITVRDAIDGSLIGAGFTDGEGSIVFPDLQEGYYTIDARADQHGTFHSTTLVAAGPQTSIEAFLARQTVSYNWSVVPTYTEDHYEIVIDAVFETNVPAPVVTIDPPLVDLRQINEENTQINFTVTNHGLIAAQQVRLNVGTHPRWQIVPLIREIGTLPAMTSVVIPVTIRDLEFGGGLRDSGCFGISFEVAHVVICQIERNYTVPVVFIQNPAACGGPGGGWVPPACEFCGPGGGPGGPGGGPGGGHCEFCTIPPFNLPRIETTGSCNPCVTDCALAGLECAASFNPYFNCPYGISRNCPPDSFDSIGGAIKCIGDGVILSCIPIPFTNEYQCLCNIGKACTCCPGAPFPPCGIGDIVNWFSPSGGGGGGGGGGFCGGGGMRGDGGGDGPSDPIVDRVFQIYTRIGQAAAYLAYPFGDSAFIAYEPADGPIAQAWLETFNAATEDASTQGQSVSASERAALHAQGYPAPVTDALMDAYLDRYNRTVEYNALGYINRGDLPAGMDPDFIAVDEYQLLYDRAISAVEQNQAEGYDSFSAAMLNVLDVLHDDRTRDDEGVCARVRIQINQQAVITRAAFRANLEIENSGGTESLQDIGVDIIVQDEAGNVVTDRFGVYPPELTNLNAVDGSGTLSPNSTGSASWLIVPGDEAAPTTTTTYYVSGTLTYSLGGQSLTLPLFPAAIQVVPNASLSLKYFLEKLVFSDDPFTPEVEPPVPFSLGLIMTNNGYGSAYNVSITSAQPEIVENDRGLLIDFAIIGTQVGFQNVSPSLTVALGDLLPGATAVARWLLTCSLQGEFIEYNASFRHVNGLGREDLSLIDNLEIHEMTHVVRGLSPADDLLPDFLANDTVDTDDLPDTLHLSDGSEAPVTSITAGTFDGAANTSDTSVELQVAAAPGYNYVVLDDPSFGDLPLTRVTRSDGRVLLAGFNFWQTRRIVRHEHDPDEAEILVHLFDHGGSGHYTLLFSDGSNPCPGGAGDISDADGDGTPNCIDACPNDPNKTSPGSCGCNVADADTDGDGTPNCSDGCPNDPAKIAAGDCGCGVADVDTDGDGTADCADGCPGDPSKTNPGVCGCNSADADSDGDGVLDCLDGCPSDPTKTDPGRCGCNVAEMDSDGDTVPDCVDNCPSVPNIGQQDFDFDGIGNACDCPCNVNGDTFLDSQDYFAFVEGFLSGNADINGYDGTDSQDFFDFVDCFTSGCR